MCDEIDYIAHFFFSCKKIKMIWCEIEKLLSQKYDIDIKLDMLPSQTAYPAGFETSTPD